jgi:hypothetical protein
LVPEVLAYPGIVAALALIQVGMIPQLVEAHKLPLPEEAAAVVVMLISLEAMAALGVGVGVTPLLAPV